MEQFIKNVLTLILFFNLSTTFSQENKVDNLNKKFQFNAIVELGFLNVFDHKVQFGNSGTYFDYRRDGGQDILFPVSRLSLEFKSGRSTFYLLYQPLRLESQVLLKNDLLVDNALFSAGSSVKLLYNFPFYRFSYTCELFPNLPKFNFALGASIQIRNAIISFESADGSIFRTNRNVGIVPALKIKTNYHFNDRFYTEIEADGIYAPVSYLNGSDNEVVGAILDASLRGCVSIVDHVDGFLNMRYLGGGAVGTSDNMDGPGDGYVRNWLHFGTVTVGFKYKF
jgi:hypothetical protein